MPCKFLFVLKYYLNVAYAARWIILPDHVLSGLDNFESMRTLMFYSNAHSNTQKCEKVGH